MFFVDEQVKKNCWNVIDSYGEICVHCGCCSPDKKTRYEARLNTVKGWIRDKENFDLWADDEETRKIQEHNIAADLKSLKRMRRYYRKKYREVCA